MRHRPLQDNPFTCQSHVMERSRVTLGRWFNGIKIVRAFLLISLIVWSVKDIMPRIERIEIYGEAKISEQTLLDALQIATGDSLYGFSLGEARKRVSSLPLVSVAQIQRLSHGVVRLMITERIPAMIHIRADGNFALLDEEGFHLQDVEDLNAYDLPIFKGNPSPQESMAVWHLTLNYPLVGHDVTLYHYVSGRWDIIVNHDTRIMLAENDVAASWRNFLNTDELERHLRKVPKVIDARQPDDILFSMIVHDEEAG